MPTRRPRVGIVMGSDSDLEVLRETIKVLDQTNPDRARVGEARETIARGFKKFMLGKQNEIDSLLMNQGGAKTAEETNTDTETDAKAA